MVVWPVHVPWSDLQGNDTVPQIPVHRWYLSGSSQFSSQPLRRALATCKASGNSPGMGEARGMLLPELMQHLRSIVDEMSLLWVTVLCTVTVPWSDSPCSHSLTAPASLRRSELQQNGQHCGIGACLWRCLYLIQNALLSGNCHFPLLQQMAFWWLRKSRLLQASHSGDLKAVIPDNIEVEVFPSCAVDITAHYRVMVQRIHPGTSHARLEKINLC